MVKVEFYNLLQNCDKPIEEAASLAGISSTFAKSLCREYKMKSWTYRRIRSIRTIFAEDAIEIIASKYGTDFENIINMKQNLENLISTNVLLVHPYLVHIWPEVQVYTQRFYKFRNQRKDIIYNTTSTSYKTLKYVKCEKEVVLETNEYNEYEWWNDIFTYDSFIHMNEIYTSV